MSDYHVPVPVVDFGALLEAAAWYPGCFGLDDDICMDFVRAVASGYLAWLSVDATSAQYHFNQHVTFHGEDLALAVKAEIDRRLDTRARS